MENQVTNRPRLLIVERDPLMLAGISAVLDMKGYHCFMARDCDVGLQACETMQFDLIVYSVDSELQEIVAGALQLRSHQRGVELPIIFLVSELREEWFEPLSGVGGVFCLTKPFEPDALIQAVDQSLWMPHLAKSFLDRPKSPGGVPQPHFTSQWVRLS